MTGGLFGRCFQTIMIVGFSVSVMAQGENAPKPKPKPKPEVKVAPVAPKLSHTDELRVQREKRALFLQQRAARSDGRVTAEERSQLRHSRNQMTIRNQHRVRNAGRR